MATKEQIKMLRERFKETVKEQPTWAFLRDTLLKIGGVEVVYLFEEDMKSLIAAGKRWPTRRAIKMPGEPSQCHWNCAQLWTANKERTEIVTGWALSPDGLWRQHTWAWDKQEKRVLETTEKRTRYFGFALNPKRAEKFCWNNY